MVKKIKLPLLLFVFCIFFNINLFAEDDLLTIKQKIDRLQREMNDLSKSVFSNGNSTSSSEDNIDNQAVNFAAIDMRIYDLEKDIKGLTMNLEELIFKLDEIENKLNSFEAEFDSQLKKITMQQSKENKSKILKIETDTDKVDENSLGTLKISSLDESAESNDVKVDGNSEKILTDNLSPEDQFQLAFDKIRKKEYEQAKILLGDFIKNNSENQLSGSAHYWLGELFLLEKNNREAALILAEGYQKFPKSVKAPDILYKLSEALFEINKNQEACKTLTKLIKDFPNHKLKNKSQVKQTQESCNILVE